MVILLFKGNGKFRGIGLVEFLWKTVLDIINRRIGTVVCFHNVLHELCACQGVGVALIKYKLLRQVMVMREDVI